MEGQVCHINVLSWQESILVDATGLLKPQCRNGIRQCCLNCSVSRRAMESLLIFRAASLVAALWSCWELARRRGRGDWPLSKQKSDQKRAWKGQEVFIGWCGEGELSRRAVLVSQITSDQAGIGGVGEGGGRFLIWWRLEAWASEEAGLGSLKPGWGCRGVWKWRQVGAHLLISGSCGCCAVPLWDKLEPWRV